MGGRYALPALADQGGSAALEPSRPLPVTRLRTGAIEILSGALIRDGLHRP